jgi:NADPH:quinone reductase-like Zn-dependent oxidoreductase
MPRDQKEQLYRELSGDIRDGTLNVNIEATYDISDIKDALAHAVRQSRDGKIIVLPNGAP